MSGTKFIGGCMKKFTSLLLSVSAITILSGVTAYAQGKGAVKGPSVNDSHGTSTSHDQTKGSSHSSNSDDKSGWTVKFDDRVKNDPDFATRIQGLLPMGADLKAAESGFKNQGQFIAALHVSKNLNIPFDQLKAKMTGISTTPGAASTVPESLGKAIHDLKPSLPTSQANDEAKKAEQQAKLSEKGKATT